MPKLTQEQRQEIEISALFQRLAKSTNGVNLVHQLTEDLAGISKGTFVFGNLRFIHGCLDIVSTGTSNPGRTK